MANRIEISLKPGFTDSRAESIRNRIRNELHIDVIDVRSVNVFTLNFNLPEKQLNFIGRDLFRDKVTEHHSINSPIADDFDYRCYR
jgi:phosphoribosylformylglycinamidine (FGAM) synthase PurS component